MTYAELKNQLGQLSGSETLYNQLGYLDFDFWDDSEHGEDYAKNMMRMLAGDSDMGAPSGTTWGGIFSSMNPITAKQLYGATYNTMRPAISKGMGSLQSELLNNLSKVRTGGFESS